MTLEEQVKLVRSAQVFFDGNLKKIIEDNQRRYRMKLKDSKERTSRGLSSLPSTKSTAAVDRFVERSIIEYHQDPDSISFSSKSIGDTQKDAWAKILSEDFRYRSKSTNNGFNFFLWNQASLTAGAVDGIECGLFRWEKVSYTEKVKKYFAVDPTGSQTEVPQEVYDKARYAFPEMFTEADVDNEVVCKDTFVIDQLKPGEDIVWDPKVQLLDAQNAEFMCVFLDKSVQDVQNMATAGIIDPIEYEEIKKYQKSGQSNRLPLVSIPSGNDTRTIEDPNTLDLHEQNRVKVWMFFFKEGNRKMVQFSIDGKKELAQPKSVDEAFFGGRKVNRYPVSIGTTKLKLWENAGRSIPETIAPIEDEHIDHKNNINDAAKIAIQGRYRIDPDADLNIDDLLNGRAFYADKGSFDRMEDDFGVLTAMRANDTTVSDIMELIPAGMMTGARGLVAKGTAQTLGAKQLGKMEADEKLGVAIMTRNETFLKPGLYLIAQLIMAFETDETVLRIAGAKAGVALPEKMTPQGKSVIDLSPLDFDVDIEINAGLGSSNRDQKASSTMQLVDWGKSHGVNVDSDAAFQQLCILAGYSADQLLSKQQPEPPKNKLDYRVSVSVKYEDLPMDQQLLVMEGLAKADFDPDNDELDEGRMNEARQNGEGMMIPNRTGQIVDATGEEAAAMSQGGMNS